MVRRVGHHDGGILGLVDFLEVHGEAVEYDLIGRGLRLRELGSARFSWLDLQIIVRGAPRDSAIGRSIGGATSEWGVTEHLLALLVDAVVIGNWQRQGNPHAPRPHPLSRPGAPKQGTHLGKEPIPVGDFEEWWNSIT